MFKDFTKDEIRDLMELLYAVSYVDDDISDEEIAVLSCVASILNVREEDWKPNLIDIDFVFKRLGQMEYSKVVRVIVFVAQLSKFDGKISDSELKLLLPLAAENGISNNKLMSIVDNALNGYELTDFDKIIAFALILKAVYHDGYVTSKEEEFIMKLKEKYGMPENYYEKALVDNFPWILRVLKTYNKDKLIYLFKEVIKALVYDDELNDQEINFIVFLSRIYDLREDLPNIFSSCLGV